MGKINIFLSIQLLLLAPFCRGQQTNVVLENQGALLGLKVFPDSARTAVYAFLGVPYAQPPIDDLRFAPPKPHQGWNWTLHANTMKPICPQLTGSIYDETPDGTPDRSLNMAEDCLYLNVWVPEFGGRFGNLPVLVIITGEQMSFDWPRNRPSGLDFAAEGVIVITLQYRNNIFGWMNLGKPQLSGNFGLQDQLLALRWVQKHVKQFGGDPRRVTLLGHGTSGVPCVLAHLLGDSDTRTLFSQTILMSGGDSETVLASNASVLEASRVLVQKLGCQFEAPGGTQVVSCLRSKSVSDLQQAFASIYEHGNGSKRLGPVVPLPLQLAWNNKTWTQQLPPMLVGICSREGAFLEDQWLQLAREDYTALSDYVNHTLLPQVLRGLLHSENTTTAGVRRQQQLLEALNWQFFATDAETSSSQLLYAMQRLISEYRYEVPFFRLLENLTAKRIGNQSYTSPTYAYVFDVSHAMDMRGKVNLFGGAGHSSDLPLLLGPSLFQQIARRRFSANEEQLCRKMKAVFSNFVKSGNPIARGSSDEWLTYTPNRRFVFKMSDAVSTSNERESHSEFEPNWAQIEQLLEQERPSGNRLSRPNRNEYAADSDQPISSFDRRHKAASYQKKQDQRYSSYALHLKKVYGFWQLLLPTINSNGEVDGISDALSQRMRLMEASANVQRYRHGFFALLGLMFFLLAVLGLCVYLLRRDPLKTSSHARGCRL